MTIATENETAKSTHSLPVALCNCPMITNRQHLPPCSVCMLEASHCALSKWLIYISTNNKQIKVKPVLLSTYELKLYAMYRWWDQHTEWSHMRWSEFIAEHINQINAAASLPSSTIFLLNVWCWHSRQKAWCKIYWFAQTPPFFSFWKQDLDCLDCLTNWNFSHGRGLDRRNSGKEVNITRVEIFQAYPLISGIWECCFDIALAIIE